MKINKALLIILCNLFTLNIHAWWDTGHALICDAAYDRLSPEIKQKVDDLIPEKTYGEGCVWPDILKQSKRSTSPWHYINLPPGEVEVTETNCPRQGCLIDAFYDQLDLLRDGDFNERRDAVRFIGHFIGDAHQPLHTGYGFDRGGNGHKLTLENGNKTNMHMVWDGHIIEYILENIGEEKFMETFSSLTDQYLSKLKYDSDMYAWATESRVIAMSDSVQYRQDIRLKIANSEYLKTHSGVVIDRLALSSARLAILLEQELIK